MKKCSLQFLGLIHHLTRFKTITGTGSDNTDSGILLSDSGGTVLILGDGSVAAAQTGNTITLTGTDTGITGVTLAVADSAGEPLLRTITNRELTLTSAKYVGGANVGYVPEGGTGTTYLKGDGTWEAIPTGLIFKGTWDARNIAEGGASDGGDPDLDGIAGAADGWLYIVSVAGSAVPNGAATTPNSWNLGDWCVYDGTNWTRVPSTNAGVTTVDTTNGTYMDLTPVTATGGNVVITADLSAVDASGAVPDDSLFLRKDNKWSTAITEVAPLFGQSPNYGGIIISPAVTTATYLNDENVTSSVTLTLTAVNAAIEVGDIISGVGITVGTEVDAISVSGLVITMSNSNIIAENQTLVYTKATSNANLASVSLDYYGGNNMILAAEPEPVDNTTNPPTPIYPNYTTDEMLWTQASGGAAKNVYRSRLENFPFAPITASGTVKSVTGLSIITTNGSGNGGGIEVTGSINVDPIVSVKYDLPTVIGTDTRWNIIDAAAPAGGSSNIDDSILVLQTQGGGMGTVGKQPLSKLPFYDNVFAPATEFIRTDNQQVTNSVTIVFNNSTATIEQGMQVSFVGMVGTPTVSSVTTNPNFSIILTGSNQSINAGTSITFKGIGEIGVVPAPTIATLADQDGYFLNSNADWGVALTEVLPLVGQSPNYGGIIVDPSVTTSTFSNDASTASVTLVLTVANTVIETGWVITGDDIDSSGAAVTVTTIVGNTLTLSAAQTIAEDATLFYTKPTTSSGTTSLSVDYLGGFNVVSAAYAQSGNTYTGSFTPTLRTNPANQILVYNKDLTARRVEAIDLADLPFAPYTSSGTVQSVTGLAVANTTPAENGAGNGGGITVSASNIDPIVSVKYDLPNVRATDTIWNVIAAAPALTRNINSDSEILVLEADGSAVGTVQRHKISDLPATTISNFTVSTNSTVGTAGLVPAPAIATQGGTYYLNGNATFTVPPNTMGTGFTVSADTNTTTTTITQGDTLTLIGGTNVTTVSDPDGTITINSTDQYTGTVTSVAANTGLTGGTITSSGTLKVQYTGVASVIMAAFANGVSFSDSDEFIRSTGSSGTASVERDTLGDLKAYIASGAPSGTVTSVGSGDGLTGGAITSSGALAIDYTNSTSNLINNPTIGISTISVPTADSILILKTTGSASAIGSVQRTAISNLPFTNNTGTVTPSSTDTFTNKSGSNSQWTNDENYSTTTGTVTPSSTDTFTNKSGNISMWTNDSGYSTTTGTVTPSSTDTFTNKSGSNSQWTNDEGYTTNVGTIEGIIGGTALSGQGTSGTVTLNVRYAGTSSVIFSANPAKGTDIDSDDVILYTDSAGATVNYGSVSDLPFDNGTVTSVGGTGTVSGLTLTGTVTSTGNLTLGGTLSLTSANITDGLGYTPLQSETDTLADVTARGGASAGSTSTACSFTNTGAQTFGSSGLSDIYLGNNATNKFIRFHTNNVNTYFDMNCGFVYWRQASSTRFEQNMTNGTFTASGDVVAFGSPSDKRLKENIKPIESALDKAMKLQGVTFDWKKSDSILSIKKDIGFIAQDVQKVAPELVRENEDGYLSMRHQGIAPILLEAIKELKAEIEELKLNKCNCNN